MTDLERLSRVGALGTVLVRAVPISNFSSELLRWQSGGMSVRHLRGWKMKTSQAFFDEFAAALQFTYYFGENWNAFHDCFEDMEWLPESAAIVIAIADAGSILSDEPEEDEFFGRSLSRAISTHASPVTDGEWWDRPAVPFHIVFQCTELEIPVLRARMRTAGLTLEDL